MVWYNDNKTQNELAIVTWLIREFAVMAKSSKTKLQVGQEKFRQSLTSLSHHSSLLSYIECKCQGIDREDRAAGVGSVGRGQETANSTHLCNRPTAWQSWDHQPCMVALGKHIQERAKSYGQRKEEVSEERKAAEGRRWAEEPVFSCSPWRNHYRVDECSWRNCHLWRAYARAEEKDECKGTSERIC